MKQPIEKGYITQLSNVGSHVGYKAWDIGWISLGNQVPYLLAVENATVMLAGDFTKSTGAGNQVVLEIDSFDPNWKYLARYVHNKQNLVKKGDKVLRGQRVAIGGNTGNSFGPHVHFEIWKVPRNFVFTGYNYVATRKKYTVEPNSLVNFDNIDQRFGKKLTLNKYSETPLVNTKATTEATSLNMRDYPSLASLSAGAMPLDLEAVAKTSKVHGYEWIKCKYKGRYVYVASNWIKLVPLTIPTTPEIIEIIKEVEVIKEVEKPFKETFERNGLKVTVEKVV